MNKSAQAFYDAIGQLPKFLSTVLCKVPDNIAENITEVRLKSNRPILLNTSCESLFITREGIVSANFAINSLCTSHLDIEECYKAICSYSVHSHHPHIIQGFVPLRGGHRVGIGATAVYTNDEIDTLKNITSLNMRIARTNITVCDSELLDILAKGSFGIILAGEPGSGKTTMLRSLMHALSKLGKNVSVIDERFEIAPVSSIGFSSNIPLRCDVLSGYPKHLGMIHALRSLAPDVILCDELGRVEDANAVSKAANSGVSLVVTMHADSISALKRRPQAKAVLDTGAFEYVVFLKNRQKPGKVREVINLANYC